VCGECSASALTVLFCVGWSLKKRVCLRVGMNPVAGVGLGGGGGGGGGGGRVWGGWWGGVGNFGVIIPVDWDVGGRRGGGRWGRRREGRGELILLLWNDKLDCHHALNT